MASKAVPDELVQYAVRERRRISSLGSWRRFSRSFNSLHASATKGPFPFDPKFNSIHWAFDVSSLCNQIAYGLTWTNAYATYYKTQVPKGSVHAHTDFGVQYYADNCASRIDSCRDKMALMVWSHYCAFNPERRREVLTYEEIMDRLRYPIRFGLDVRDGKPFVQHLLPLQGKDFEVIGQYRDHKIHRREPRIELYGPARHHDWPYMLALTDPKEIAKFKKSIEHEGDWVLESSSKKGILFDRRTLKGRLWDYAELAKRTEACLLKLLVAGTGCFKVLRGRKPFRK